jgi:hypothetical protein
MSALGLPDRIVPLHFSERDGELLDRLCARMAPEGIDPRDPSYQSGIVHAIVAERLAAEDAASPLEREREAAS